MTVISRHDPRAKRALAKADSILANDPRIAKERALAKQIATLEHEVANLRKNVDAIIRREMAALRKKQDAPAPAPVRADYVTRDRFAH